MQQPLLESEKKLIKEMSFELMFHDKWDLLKADVIKWFNWIQKIQLNQKNFCKLWSYVNLNEPETWTG